MSQLTSKFESETGNVAMYRKDGADYHTLRYVNWLEALVEKFNCSAQSGPTNTTQAEIAVIFLDHFSVDASGKVCGVHDIEDLGNKLRQLSAVR